MSINLKQELQSHKITEAKCLQAAVGMYNLLNSAYQNYEGEDFPHLYKGMLEICLGQFDAFSSSIIHQLEKVSQSINAVPSSPTMPQKGQRADSDAYSED